MTSLMAAQRLGIVPYVTSAPAELYNNRTEEDADVVIRAVYRQVLGNAHVMESERLTVPESQLKSGAISVREFVRQVAKSAFYRDRFFENCPRYRAIELNFKHLLGRAPESFEEMKAHSKLLDEGGYEAEIDSYLDSDEYQKTFGESQVPYYRGFATEGIGSMVGFSRLFQLYRGYAHGDRAQGNSKGTLAREVMQNTASSVNVGSMGESIIGVSGGGREQFYRVRVTQGAPGGRARVRRSNCEYLIAYEQLSNRLQQINRQGGTVTSIIPA